jgi:hypothetical protein
MNRIDRRAIMCMQPIAAFTLLHQKHNAAFAEYDRQAHHGASLRGRRQRPTASSRETSHHPVGRSAGSETVDALGMI